MGQQDQSDEGKHSNDESPPHGRQNDGGHSGEGAASAMRQMISQGDRQRHQSGEASGGAGHPQ
jgi:hypothetical protein